MSTVHLFPKGSIWQTTVGQVEFLGWSCPDRDGRELLHVRHLNGTGNDMLPIDLFQFEVV